MRCCIFHLQCCQEAIYDQQERIMKVHIRIYDIPWNHELEYCFHYFPTFYMAKKFNINMYRIQCTLPLAYRQNSIQGEIIKLDSKPNKIVKRITDVIVCLNPTVRPTTQIKKAKEMTESFGYRYWNLTERTGPCPVPRLAALRACAW